MIGILSGRKKVYCMNIDDHDKFCVYFVSYNQFKKGLIFRLFNDILSAEWEKDDVHEWIIGFGRKPSWPILRQYSTFAL
jgi:hypothetical protein